LVPLCDQPLSRSQPVILGQSAPWRTLLALCFLASSPMGACDSQRSLNVDSGYIFRSRKQLLVRLS
jgi:hypothetical protein